MSSQPKLTRGVSVKLKEFTNQPITSKTPVNQPEKNFYEGIEKRKYCGVDLSKHIKDSNNAIPTVRQGIPKFLGPDGYFYTSNYERIPPGCLANIDFRKPENIIFKNYNENKRETIQELLKIPNPDDYDEFYQYDQALLDWKSHVDSITSQFQLPEVIGRSYYRPKVITDKQRSTSRGLKDLIGKIEVSNFEEMNLSDSLEIGILKDEKNKETEVPNLKNDPWDSFGYPPEPDPDSFETYEEYSDAMKRWALICQSSIKTLPPHAIQLKDMIPIQSVQLEQRKSPEEKEEEKDDGLGTLLKSGLKESTLFSKTYLQFHVADYLRDFDLEPLELKDDWKSLDVLIQSDIWDLFDKFPKTFDPSNPTPPNNNQIFSKLHGAFSPKESKTISSFLKQSKTLRRLDVPSITTAPHLFDCEQEVFGRKVDFKTPTYDIEIELFKIINDPKYRSNAERVITSIDCFYNRDYLNAWNNPKIQPDEIFESKQEVDKILSTTKYDEIGISHVLQILKGSMLLDQFQELLISNREEEGITRTYLSYLNNGLNLETFCEVLNLLDQHVLELTRSKVSFFVLKYIQNSTRSESTIDYLINPKNLKSLSYLVYALSYFSEIPISVFELTDEARALICNFLGNNSQVIVDMFLIHYYLRVMQQIVLKNPDSFQNLKSYLDQTLTSSGTSLKNTLESSFLNFLTEKLWKGLSHRSSTISATFLFFGFRVLECPDLFEYTKNKIKFFQNLIEISNSKFSHTRFAAQKLWEAFGPEKETIENFKQEFPSPLDILTRFTVNKNGQLPLGCTLIAETYSKILEQIRTEKNQGVKQTDLFFLDQTTWHNCFARISKSITNVSKQTLVLATLLSELSYTYHILGNIEPEISVKTSLKKSNELTISPRDLVNMYFFIAGASGNNNKITAQTRKHVLRSLRYLLKNGPIFDFMKRDIEFFAKVDSWCRDSEDGAFNREAWKLFYQLIYYHQGVVEFLLKGNTLSHFFDLVGTGYHNIVVTNALHYVTKLFSMESIEMSKQVSGKSPTRGDKDSKDRGLKSYEKDVKALCNFFVQRSLFIKVHMIYKKFTYTEKPQFGGTFLELAKFYQLIATSASCEKVYRDTIKKPEYKKGIDDIRKMFGESLESNSFQMRESFEFIPSGSQSTLQNPISANSGTIKQSSQVRGKATTSPNSPSATATKFRSAVSKSFGNFLKKIDKKN